LNQCQMNKQSLTNVLFSPPPLPPSSLFPFGVDSFPSLPFPALISLPSDNLPSSDSPGWVWHARRSLGLRFPLRDRHLPLLAGGSQRGALHEEDLLQAAAPLLHSSGDWNSLLQRPLPAHSRGRVRPVGSVLFSLSGAVSGHSLAGEGEGGIGGEPRARYGGWKRLGTVAGAGVSPLFGREPLQGDLRSASSREALFCCPCSPAGRYPSC